MYLLNIFRGGRLIGMKKSAADVEQVEVANKYGMETKERAIVDSEKRHLALSHSSKQWCQPSSCRSLGKT